MYLSSLTKIGDDKITSNEKISLKEIIVEKIINKRSKIKSNENHGKKNSQ